MYFLRYDKVTFPVSFLGTNFCGPEFRGLPQTNALNTDTPMCGNNLINNPPYPLNGARQDVG